MQQFLDNRYTRLALLTFGLGALFYLVIWMATWIFNIQNFSPFLIFLLSSLGAGLLVYKFLSQRVL